MDLLSTHTKPQVVAVIAAGGSGSRLGHAGGKQLLELSGKSVLAWAIDAVASASSVKSIVVACDPTRVQEYEKKVKPELFTDKNVKFVAGGQTRQESVGNALEAIGDDEQYILVHDGARPLVKPEEIDAACEILMHYHRHGLNEDEPIAAIFAQPSVDTVKEATEDGHVIRTLNRSDLWTIQTPQIFVASVLKTAYNFAEATGYQGTDDASLAEHLGKEVQLIATSRDNIKITLKEDVRLAEFLLSRNYKR